MSADSITLPIQEIFHTWQGEGQHTGRPALFVRTYGCPVQCPWCDAAGTWHPNYRPDHIDRLTPEMIVRAAQEAQVPMCVITGGEPTVHEGVLELAGELELYGIEPHIETSGTFFFGSKPEDFTSKELRTIFNWICVSPKLAKEAHTIWLAAAHEIKLIIEKPSDIGYWLERIFGQVSLTNSPIIRLHPEWSQRENQEVLRAISNAVKNDRFGYTNLRAGWQLHKLYRVDALDTRSAKPVPLGGIIAKGY